MRIVVIDLVEMETSLQLITELLQEVPSICSDAQFDRIAATHGLLLAWVADLGLTVAARTQARKMQNPDLAVTLSALEKELSMRTQVRLGLTEQPQPSAAAMVLFERILAMMHR